MYISRLRNRRYIHTNNTHQICSDTERKRKYIIKCEVKFLNLQTHNSTVSHFMKEIITLLCLPTLFCGISRSLLHGMSFEKKIEGVCSPGKRLIQLHFSRNAVLSMNSICRVSAIEVTGTGLSRNTMRHVALESGVETLSQQNQKLQNRCGNKGSDSLSGISGTNVNGGRIHQRGRTPFFPSLPLENAPPGMETQAHVISLQRQQRHSFSRRLLRDLTQVKLPSFQRCCNTHITVAVLVRLF